MKKLILAEALCGQTRLAVLEDGLLEEIYSESAEGERCVGNIYAGRVENVLPGMQAAFVNIGLEKNAYLSVADIPVDKSDLGIDEKDVLRNASIKTLLRPGQEILVQGIKEPGGTKGARISCHITLPGRYCVLMPTVDCVGVSRKITQAEERARLHDLADALRPQGMGIIVRTAAEHVEEAKLRDDIAAMLRLWGTIQTRQRYGVAPALLHRDLSLIYQAVRDMLAGEDVEMLIENEAQYRAAREVASMFSPECESRMFLSFFQQRLPGTTFQTAAETAEGKESSGSENRAAFRTVSEGMHGDEAADVISVFVFRQQRRAEQHVESVRIHQQCLVDVRAVLPVQTPAYFSQLLAAVFGRGTFL